MRLTSVPDSARAPTIPDVLAEHLEELGFLSLQKRKLLFSEECTPSQFARHTRRIEAHWAGLCVSPEDSVEIAKARLEDPVSAWDVMACVRTWIELGESKPEDLFSALAATDEDALRGWREALRRLPERTLMERLPWEDGKELPPSPLAVLLDAHAWHGILSPRFLDSASQSEHSGIRYALARSAFSIPSRSIRDSLSVMARDPEPFVRRAARWSGILLDASDGKDSIGRLIRNDPSDEFGNLVSTLVTEPVESAAEDSMMSFWRRAVRGGKDPWQIRREVPDGFFDAMLTEEALPGE